MCDNALCFAIVRELRTNLKTKKKNYRKNFVFNTLNVSAFIDPHVLYTSIKQHKR